MASKGNGWVRKESTLLLQGTGCELNETMRKWIIVPSLQRDLLPMRFIIILHALSDWGIPYLRRLTNNNGQRTNF